MTACALETEASGRIMSFCGPLPMATSFWVKSRSATLPSRITMRRIASGGSDASSLGTTIVVLWEDCPRAELLGDTAFSGISEGFSYDPSGAPGRFASTGVSDADVGRRSAPHWLQNRLTSRGIGALH